LICMNRFTTPSFPQKDFTLSNKFFGLRLDQGLVYSCARAEDFLSNRIFRATVAPVLFRGFLARFCPYSALRAGSFFGLQTCFDILSPFDFFSCVFTFFGPLQFSQLNLQSYSIGCEPHRRREIAAVGFFNQVAGSFMLQMAPAIRALLSWYTSLRFGSLAVASPLPFTLSWHLSHVYSVCVFIFRCLC